VQQVAVGAVQLHAVQAGREVRILVRPEEIDDLTASRLARDIVKKIEDQLTYPGQIKVTVIRETRPLADVNEAIADVEAGRVAARIVLQP